MACRLILHSRDSTNEFPPLGINYSMALTIKAMGRVGSTMSTRNWLLFAFVIFSWNGGSLTALGKYASTETEKVPIDRLLTNLKAKLTKDPTNADLHYALARLHGMAYAQKSNDAEVVKGTDDVFLGRDIKRIPYEVTKTEDTNVMMKAQQHLAYATQHYRKALLARPNDPLLHLGLGWCYQNAKKPKDAVSEYRKAWSGFLSKEKDTKQAHGRNWSGAKETAEYLIPLLDPTTDKAEIEEIKTQADKLTKVSFSITPIVVALSKSTTLAEIVDGNHTARFDADGSGTDQRWTWISPSAAWLAYAPNGEIKSGRDLFGSVTFWIFWANGYDALASLDDDGNGRLEFRELDGLVLWQDVNSDGIADRGEVTDVRTSGIRSIHVGYSRHESGIPWRQGGAIWANGDETDTFDIDLKTISQYSQSTPSRR